MCEDAQSSPCDECLGYLLNLRLVHGVEVNQTIKSYKLIDPVILLVSFYHTLLSVRSSKLRGWHVEFILFERYLFILILTKRSLSLLTL